MHVDGDHELNHSTRRQQQQAPVGQVDEPLHALRQRVCEADVYSEAGYGYHNGEDDPNNLPYKIQLLVDKLE